MKILSVSKTAVFCLLGVVISASADQVVNFSFDKEKVGKWYSNKFADLSVVNGYLNIKMTDPSYRSVFTAIKPEARLINVGNSVSLQFGVKREEAVKGFLRVYLRSADDNELNFMFQSSLGEKAKPLIGFYKGSAGRSGSASEIYAAKRAVDPAGTDEPDFYVFKITLLSSNSLQFDLSRNNVSVVSAVKKYDGSDRPKSEMITSFDRILFGWTKAGDEGGRSFQLDNVSLSVLP